MTTFAEILNEANQLLDMADVFESRYIQAGSAKMDSPSIVIPATDNKQGEAKEPTVKPNSITR
jgi:hypothetical protein